MTNYDTVIGLEVHAQLSTESKLFCGCRAAFGDMPNSNVCPVCLGLPGSLPVLNKQAVHLGIKACLSLKCRIENFCRFDRKNYFYPDLPKGYQITQYQKPLARDGQLEIVSKGGVEREIRIERIHLEEDAGKTIYAGESGKSKGEGAALIDLNRCGIPLLEIVTKPDLRSPEEARIFLKKLRDILNHIGVCEGDMEKGHVRCDANISIRSEHSGNMQGRAEVKNINSFRFLEQALSYERERQAKMNLCGQRVENETRSFNQHTGKTRRMRSKEKAMDYRYFPDPDLLPVRISETWILACRNELPESRRKMKQRLMHDYGLPAYDAEILTSSLKLAKYFERAAATEVQPRLLSNWIMTEVMREIKERNNRIEEFPVGPEKIGELLLFVQKGDINRQTARHIFTDMIRTGGSAGELIQEKQVALISDEDQLRRAAVEIIESSPRLVEEYREGKEKLMGFFMGQMMKRTKGKADPHIALRILKLELEKENNG